MAISKEEILEAVGAMTVMELNDLVKAFEEKFGVSAAALAVAAPGAAGAGAAAAEEKSDGCDQRSEDCRAAGRAEYPHGDSDRWGAAAGLLLHDRPDGAG